MPTSPKALIGEFIDAAVRDQERASKLLTSDTRETVLDCAVERGNVRLVTLLLAAGADAQYRTDLGGSVFDAVPSSGAERESILAVLVEHGVVSDDG